RSIRTIDEEIQRQEGSRLRARGKYAAKFDSFRNRAGDGSHRLISYPAGQRDSPAVRNDGFRNCKPEGEFGRCPVWRKSSLNSKGLRRPAPAIVFDLIPTPARLHVQIGVTDAASHQDKHSFVLCRTHRVRIRSASNPLLRDYRPTAPAEQPD